MLHTIFLIISMVTHFIQSMENSSLPLSSADTILLPGESWTDLTQNLSIELPKIPHITPATHDGIKIMFATCCKGRFAARSDELARAWEIWKTRSKFRRAEDKRSVIDNLPAWVYQPAEFDKKIDDEMVLDDFAAVAVNIFNMPSLTAEEIGAAAVSIRKAWDNRLWELGINKRDYLDDTYRYSQEISTTQTVVSAALGLMDATQVGENSSQESSSAQKNFLVRKTSCKIVKKHLRMLSRQLNSQVLEIQARHQDFLENIAEKYRAIACQALLGEKITGNLRVRLEQALEGDKLRELKEERRRTTNRRYALKARKKREVNRIREDD